MRKNLSILEKSCSRCAALIILFTSFMVVPAALLRAATFTPQQIEAFETRVGNTFWIASVDNRTPTFQTRPAANASSFRAKANDSFIIVELVGQKTGNLYYKVKFESDEEGYITPQAFHEEFNLTILTIDPQANEKKKAAQRAEEEKQRAEWIQAQPWSQSVKDAAINHKPVPGMNTTEVRKVLGIPLRIRKPAGSQKPGTRQNFTEERWLYANGSELVFQNGLLIRVESSQNKEVSPH